MSRAFQRGVAYDERTGLKVKGKKLKQDYYGKFWTQDPDDAHPQDFPVVPGPDGVNYPYGPPEKHAINTVSVIDDYMDVSTMQQVTIGRLSLAARPTFAFFNHDGIVTIALTTSLSLGGGHPA